MIELLNTDCMTYMAEQPDNAFDLAIVDPPYGIGNWIQVTGDAAIRENEVTWNDSPPPMEYFNELVRVSAHRIIWGANYYGFVNGRGGAIVWDKCMARDTGFSMCEIASYDRVSKVDYVRMPFPSKNRIHPCQKPVKLYEWLLTNYAEKGQRILDTHLGSGSSAIAAHYFGCDFVGMEIDTDYYNAAVERFNNETKQIDMFGGDNV